MMHVFSNLLPQIYGGAWTQHSTVVMLGAVITLNFDDACRTPIFTALNWQKVLQSLTLARTACL